jgi:SP family myo-inositol transporter-like MFS transporter 13
MADLCHSVSGRLLVWYSSLSKITPEYRRLISGYDTGVISAVLVSLRSDLGHVLSSNEQELVTSLTSGGDLVGAIIAGLSAEKYGRKLAIYLGCFLFIVGAVNQAASFGVAQMAVGRFVIGLGVGSAAMIIPLYIGELAPAKYRGRMIAFDNMSVTLGQLISYAIGAGFTEVSHGWRYMIELGCCTSHYPDRPPAYVPGITSPITLPQLSRGGTCCPSSHLSKCDRAATVRQDEVDPILNHRSKRGNWRQIDVVGLQQLWNDAANRRALICACTVMAISQLGGFNTLMYYSSTLFALVGFNKPVAVSIVVGAINFLFTFFNMVIIDKAGRRKILLVTVAGIVSFLHSSFKLNLLTFCSVLESCHCSSRFPLYPHQQTLSWKLRE